MCSVYHVLLGESNWLTSLSSRCSSVIGHLYIFCLWTIITLLFKGNIIKKLPRKTAVSVNDTATFCVELDNECQNICWLKNTEEVKPSDRISIIRSGKQHTMIIRECTMEDAGEIVFLADESRTSTQFTVTSKFPLYLALVLSQRVVRHWHFCPGKSGHSCIRGVLYRYCYGELCVGQRKREVGLSEWPTT